MGLAIAADFLKRGWDVVGTVRGDARTEVHDLADQYKGRLEIESVDITSADQIVALHDRCSGRSFDVLLSNAGTADEDQGETIAEVTTEQFVRVMVTNALGTMRVVEGLQDLVPATGVIGVMSSGQGSITNNTTGDHDVYRGSKAALNMCMRSYAARNAGDSRALLLIAPGWIRTDLGGPNAPLSIEETIPKVADLLLEQRGKPGLRFLDREGHTVPW